MYAMDKETVRATLPQVGDVRYELLQTVSNFCGDREPQRCVVVEVNHAHLWYRVEFENGLQECYKLPVGTIDPLGGVTYDRKRTN